VLRRQLVQGDGRVGDFTGTPDGIKVLLGRLEPVGIAKVVGVAAELDLHQRGEHILIKNLGPVGSTLKSDGIVPDRFRVRFEFADLHESRHKSILEEDLDLFLVGRDELFVDGEEQGLDRPAIVIQHLLSILHDSEDSRDDGLNILEEFDVLGDSTLVHGVGHDLFGITTKNNCEAMLSPLLVVGRLD